MFMQMQDSSRNMSKRNLLICFDAFGTLFTPRRPIAQQYGDVARACGLGGFSDEDVAASFKRGRHFDRLMRGVLTRR